MLSNTLIECDSVIGSIDCCKGDNFLCNCVNSLVEDYHERPDSYDCEKKMGTYVLRYGPIYASEIYHYLNFINFKEYAETKDEINIVSLGCGFAPDYAAVKEYLYDNNIDISVNYIGIDSSDCWDMARPENDECCFYNADLTEPFELPRADLVFVCKLFSTLYRNDVEDAFLDNLQHAVESSFDEETRLIFIDVNHINMGRDKFHDRMKRHLRNFNQYYFSGYTGNNWCKIPGNGIMFNIPENLIVNQLDSVGKTVVFEYGI